MRRLRCLCACALAWMCAGPTAASGASGADAAAAAAATTRDGAHDFDFNVGTWHTDIRRVLDPLAGGLHAVELHGTVTVRPLWGGRAQFEEIEADGPAGPMRGMTLFLYDPAARQWSQTYFVAATGANAGTLVGAFDADGAVLVGADTIGGRAILVRAVWSDITRDAHRLEESFSDDGGRTWHVAFSARLTRSAS